MTNSVTTCDHDWEFKDDSFDHEYGTEVVHYMQCTHCDLVRPMESNDYEDDYDTFSE